jgi:3-methyl-2-oxobutanoate hydroxymethyltransferase
MVPEESAKIISENINIPTIGIGAGKYCDGQVLVVDDILGKFSGNIPKFAKQYTDLKTIMKNAITQYNNEVKNLEFPTKEHSFNLTDEEREKLENNFSK